MSQDTAHGYTKLKLVQFGDINYYFIRESVFLSESGDLYLSSDFYTNTLMIIQNQDDSKYTDTILTKSGPAIPLYSPDTPDMVHDMVYSFECHCPDLLPAWLRRPRPYNWPPRSVLYDISQMDAHVVPVGCKGSDTYYQEWRICFAKG